MNKLEEANNYQEKYQISPSQRPLFHLSPPIGWINDPNGFSEFNGKKHLFFQFHPYTILWGPMHWGHAVSNDFIKWEYLPVVLAPDQSYDDFGCYSGSAITKDGEHYLVYTGVIKRDGEDGFPHEFQSQCIAKGDGLTYQKFEGNPVIKGEDLPEGFSRNHFRDPKIWKEGEEYYLVTGNLDENDLGQVLLFKSPDMENWEFVSVLKHNDNGRYGIMWECPDFFELDNKHILIVSPQDMLAGEDDIANGNHTIYFVGNYNRITNELEQNDAKLLDYGSEFYAAQTMLTEDGRRIMIAWLASWDVDTKERYQLWNGMMTLPRELSLENEVLYQRPIKEIENYWTGTVTKKDVLIQNNYYADFLKGRTVDLTIEILEGNFDKFIIHFNHNADYDTKIIYNKKKEKIIFDRTYSGIRRDIVCKREFHLIKTDDPLKLRLILDRFSAELFVNDGLQTLAAALSSPQEAEQIYLECDGECKVNIEFHEITMNEENSEE